MHIMGSLLHYALVVIVLGSYRESPLIVIENMDYGS